MDELGEALVEPVVPMQAEELSARWLGEALALGGHVPEPGAVIDVAAETIGVGVGMVGQLVRLTPTYADGTAGPASLIAKLPSPYEANRAQMQLFRYYVREALFYREVAPTSSLRVPRCYWSAIDNEQNLSALLLEDLGHLYAPDQIAGFDPALATRAVKALGTFQAEWWQSPRLDDLTWMDYGNGPITMGAVGVYHQAWPVFLANFGQLLTDQQRHIGDVVGASFEGLLNSFGGEPRTIVHTDFRAENMFFGPEGSADDVVVLDWQISTRSQGGYDVGYLVSQSFTAEQRLDHGDALLASWHDALVTNGVANFSLDDARTQLAVALAVCLVIPISVGANLDLANERGRQLTETITARAFSAAEDADVVGVLRQLGVA
jgi:hypothetical protein